MSSQEPVPVGFLRGPQVPDLPQLELLPPKNTQDTHQACALTLNSQSAWFYRLQLRGWRSTWDHEHRWTRSRSCVTILSVVGCLLTSLAVVVMSIYFTLAQIDCPGETQDRGE